MLKELDAKPKKVTFSDPDEELENREDYRNLSRCAVFAVLLSVLSLFGFLFTAFIALSVIGVGVGIIGLIGIRRYPEELSGRSAAIAGILLGIASLVTCSSYHTYIYLTEVPENHERMTWYDIKSTKHQPYKPTEKAMELDGQKVFVKGYTFPGKRKNGLSQFLLVGDFGECCFGGSPEPTHLIRVSIKNGQKIDYSLRLRKLSGTFRILSRPTQNEEGTGYIYELDADVVK